MAAQNAATPTGAARGASAEAQAPTPTTPVLSSIDQLLGGQALAGKKTLLAVAAYVILAILQATGVVGTATGDAATPTGQILTTLIASFGGLGVASKIDRVVKVLDSISKSLSKFSVPTAPPS